MLFVTDVDCVNDMIYQKPVSGFVHGCLAHWSSVKQSVIAQSCTVAEFIAAHEGLLQAESVLLTLNETPHRPSSTCCSTTTQIKKDGTFDVQKAVDHVKDCSKRRLMAMVEFVANIADLLTKVLAHTELVSKSRLCGLTNGTGGDSDA